VSSQNGRAGDAHFLTHDSQALSPVPRTLSPTTRPPAPAMSDDDHPAPSPSPAPHPLSARSFGHSPSWRERRGLSDSEGILPAHPDPHGADPLAAALRLARGSASPTTPSSPAAAEPESPHEAVSEAECYRADLERLIEAAAEEEETAGASASTENLLGILDYTLRQDDGTAAPLAAHLAWVLCLMMGSWAEPRGCAGARPEFGRGGLAAPRGIGGVDDAARRTSQARLSSLFFLFFFSEFPPLRSSAPPAPCAWPPPPCPASRPPAPTAPPSSQPSIPPSAWAPPPTQTQPAAPTPCPTSSSR